MAKSKSRAKAPKKAKKASKSKPKRVKAVKKARPVKKAVKKPAVKAVKRPVKVVAKKASAKAPIKPSPAPKPKAAPQKFHIKVENVVAFVSLGKKIPLNKLVGEIEHAEYEPEQFPGLVYRIQEPRAAALIFSSGKIVCTGAKNIDMARVAVGKVVDRIRKTGIRLPRSYDIRVENIVASSKIKAKLNLEEITMTLENAEYEPEQFPGLIYRISEPRVAFLLFSSGKIICTGAQTTKDIYTALGKLQQNLQSIGIKVTPVKD